MIAPRRHFTALAVALGVTAALATGSALAQQPGSQPMPPGHAPIEAPAAPPPGGQPGFQPPQRAQGVPLGRPIGPGGRQIPPGHGGIPFPGGARAPHGAAGESEGASHAEEHCPGHGPTDPPEHVNWWHGLIGVNNEAAESGGVSSLLWRYENAKNPCDPKNEPPPFLASLLNFAVLAFVVVRFGKKPLAEALTKRKQSITQEIDNAARLKDEAEQRLEDYEDKLDRLEDTLAELKSEYAVQAELEKAHIIAEAEQRRTRMRRDAEFRIEQELKAARVMLLQEAVQNAVAAAEALLRQRIANDDLDRVAEDYLRAIPSAMAGGATRGSQTTGAAT